MAMKGVMIMGLILLGIYAVAFIIDRIIPVSPTRHLRHR